MGCGYSMRLNEVTYGKLKTTLDVNDNLNPILEDQLSQSVPTSRSLLTLADLTQLTQLSQQFAVYYSL